jgi:hypothetical protein
MEFPFLNVPVGEPGTEYRPGIAVGILSREDLWRLGILPREDAGLEKRSAGR